MSTPTTGTRPPPHRATEPRWGRIVFGLLLAAGGVGWLLDGLGHTVPWRLAPSVGVVVVGVALLLSLAGGRGRGGLVALGVVLLLAAVAAALERTGSSDRSATARSRRQPPVGPRPHSCRRAR